MNKFRKEQCIWQRYNKTSKTWSFLVRIRNTTPNITKSFSERDYGSARRAYEQAIVFRNQCMVDMNNGISYCVSDKTLDEVFNEVFDIYPMREETKRKLYVYYNRYIKDDILIKNVNRAYITTNLNSMVRDCSDDTIARVFGLWKKIIKTAIINEYIVNDPTNTIICPKSLKRIEKHKEVVTTRTTLDEVKNAISVKMPSIAKQVNMALEVMWYCGLRPCEVFALNKNDIKNGYINVSKELGSDIAISGEVEHSNFNVIRNCKTEASVRKIPIPQNLQALLNEYVQTFKVQNILFPNSKGGYINVSHLGGRIKKLGYEFNMYQLRHTLATRLVTNNIDSRTVKEILGHENFDMSVYYARSNENLKKNALEM